MPASLPEDYEKYLETYAKLGYRLLSLAFKEVEISQSYSKQENSKILYKRNEVENNLLFVGFVYFENPLKEQTPSTLTILNNAKLRSVMVTGDNPLTSIEVAKKSNFSLNETIVFCKYTAIPHKKIAF